jgi:phosphoglycolate phosphatase
MAKRKVSVIITDLDNTLFDWFEFWYQSFNNMLIKMSEISGIPKEHLLPEIKAIHEKYQTSEYAFLIEEMPSLLAKHPGCNLVKIYADAIDAYRITRRQHLKLYPGVRETLSTFKERGCLVVAYTESQYFYTADRIRRLELDGLIDIIYSPEDHELPQGSSRGEIRKYPKEHYELKITKHRHTPKGELKPNPQLLLDIIKDDGANVTDSIYVGDSLVKDIIMAQDAGVLDVYALYGSSHRREEYELLKAVTHWTLEMVEKEKTTAERDVRPNYILKKSFNELLELFEFVRYAGGNNGR